MNLRQVKNRIFLFFCTALLVGGAFPGHPTLAQEELQTFKGIFHVHSRFSHDSNARLPDIEAVGNKLGADFIVITDHNNRDGAARYRTVPSKKPLLIFANEISSSQGHLIALGVDENPPSTEARLLMDWIRQQGGYAILAHPLGKRDPWSDWSIENWDGFEIYNFGDALRGQDWGDIIDSYYSYDHSEVLEDAQEIPAKNLKFWDEQSLKRGVIPVIAATNAHLKRSTSQFEMAMSSAAHYVWASSLDSEEIMKALGEGRGYMVFEKEPTAHGFSFWLEKDGEKFYSGDSAVLDAPSSLKITAPHPAQIRVLKDSVEAKNEETKEFVFPVTEPGIYRVEIFLDGEPWIYSNAIQAVAAETPEELPAPGV